jgi:hypothetical protein
MSEPVSHANLGSPVFHGPSVVVVMSLCGILAGCNDVKVKKPASDSTPPSLVWNVFNHGTGAQADHVGSPTLNAKRGESYRITLKAKDTGGVQSIQINPSVGSGELSWQCLDPPGGENVAANKNAVLGPQSENLSPDSNGMVLSSVFLLYELDLAMECQSGWSFKSGTAHLTGRATNYFGGVTTEELKFNVAP